MAKYRVTMTLYQDCIIEAASAEEALEYAHYQTDDDDWDDPVVDPALIVEPYDGHSPAVNTED